MLLCTSFLEGVIATLTVSNKIRRPDKTFFPVHRSTRPYSEPGLS